MTLLEAGSTSLELVWLLCTIARGGPPGSIDYAPSPCFLASGEGLKNSSIKPEYPVAQGLDSWKQGKDILSWEAAVSSSGSYVGFQA